MGVREQEPQKRRKKQELSSDKQESKSMQHKQRYSSNE